MRAQLRVLKLRLVQQGRWILALALLATAVAWLCHAQGWLQIEDMERRAYDQGLTLFTGDRGPSSDVVLLGIDDATLQGLRDNPSYARAYGTWPYERHLWARVFTHLMDEGARAIVFDAVMDERASDEGNDWALATAVTERGIPLTLGFSVVAGRPALPAVTPVNRLPTPGPQPAPAAGAQEGAVELAGFEESPAPVGAGSGGGDTGDFVETADTAAGTTPEQVAQALAFPLVAEALTLPRLDQQGPEGERLARHPVSPLPVLLPAVPGFGLVLLEEDPDGRLRRTRLAYTDGRNAYATLPLAAAADLLGASEVRLAPGRLELGSRTLELNRDGSALLDFGGTWSERFRAFSVLAVLEDSVRKEQAASSGGAWVRSVPEDSFRGKVVVVGGLSVGLGDVKSTPFESAAPGVVKHAVMLEGLLGHGFITDAPLAASLLLAFLLALLSASLILLLRWVVLEVAWPVLLFFGTFLVTGIFLRTGQLHVLTALPMYAGEFATLSAVAMNHLFATRDRERLRQAFSRYLTPSLVDELVEQQRLPSLDGEAREVSAFFSDIRGFSTFSERYKDDPRGLVRILNRYLTRVSGVLLSHGACLDKYIGDAVVCLFGAPVAMDDHALRACRGALAVRDAVQAMRAQFAAEGLPDVYTRIGVNSAVMFVGNFGSEQLLDYTAIGDGMNLAARLEGANKAYGTTVMIGERTRQLAGDAIEVRELDRVRVAGKHEPVVVYELLALKGGIDEAMRDCIARHGEGLALWRAGRFAEAAALLAAAVERHPDDGPLEVLLARCRAHRDAPPADFEGVVNLEK